jgi:hypothetical protein
MWLRNVAAICCLLIAGAALAQNTTINGMPNQTTSFSSVNVNGSSNGAINLTYDGTAATTPGTNTFQISPAVSVTTPWSLSPAAAGATGLFYGTYTSGVEQMSFTTAPTVTNLTDSGLTSGDCVQASTGGLLTTTGSACGSGGSTAWSSITGGGSNTVTTAFSTAAPWTFSVAGAASTSAIYVTGAPYTGGSATTNFPQLYLNDGTGPTTFSTAGTEIGVNTPSGFTGNVIDAHVNGGASVFSTNYLGTTTFGTAPTVTTPGTGWYLFGTDGTEPASVASGTSGFVMDSTSNAPVMWSNAVNVGPVDSEWGNQSTTLLTSNTTITSTTAVTTGIAFPTVPASTNKIGECDVNWTQATAAGGVTFSLNTSVAPTDLYASSTAYDSTSAVVNLLPVTITTSATTSVTASLTPTFGTMYHLHIDVSLINSASPETITLYALTASGSDTLTINKGSSCSWRP